ncbi:MAG: hypothetical protein GY711_33070 [bacterium]|nr:hypothetical protein [bacterium]
MNIPGSGGLSSPLDAATSVNRTGRQWLVVMASGSVRPYASVTWKVEVHPGHLTGATDSRDVLTASHAVADLHLQAPGRQMHALLVV